MPLEDTEPTSKGERLAACVRAVDEHLRAQGDALLRTARRSLIFAAHEALDEDQEARFMATAEEVERVGPPALDAFRAAVCRGIENPAEAATPEREGTAHTWPSMRTIVALQDEAAKGSETTLAGRLAEAAGVSPVPDKGPVSLAGLCERFQQAVDETDAGAEARDALLEGFEATVVARLGTLVDSLDAILDGRDSGAGEQPTGPAETDAPAETGADDAAAARAETPAAPPPEPLAPSVEPVRLLGAIASVERQMLEVAPGRGLQALSELEAQLTSALTPPGTVLGASETQAVRAIASLVHQAFAHPGIDPDVRTRLWKLAPPLALLSLQDDGQLDVVLQGTRHDPVTGLLDRAAFRVRLEASLTSAARTGSSFALCVLGVDDFDAFLRRTGPAVASRLLRVLADLMLRRAGDGSQLARLRGAEFAVLLPGRRPDTGWRFAQRYLADVERAHFAAAGVELAPKVSVGVVESDHSLTTVTQMMAAADAALRSAQEDGGGCARVHVPYDGA